MEPRRLRARTIAKALSLLGAVAVASALATGASAREATAPASTAPPTISGQAQDGKTLTASNGTWSNSPASFAYQWLQCDQGGSGCQPINGATQRSYTSTASDTQKTLRVQVTATNSDGSAAGTSNPTAVVTSTAVKPQTQPPTLTFVSLKRVGTRLYARFTVCDNSSSRVAVVERDAMAGESGYVRHFAVAPSQCNTKPSVDLRNWTLISRYRHAGRFTATLRAVASSNAASATVSRSIVLHGAL